MIGAGSPPRGAAPAGLIPPAKTLLECVHAPPAPPPQQRRGQSLLPSRSPRARAWLAWVPPPSLAGHALTRLPSHHEAWRHSTPRERGSFCMSPSSDQIGTGGSPAGDVMMSTVCARARLTSQPPPAGRTPEPGLPPGSGSLATRAPRARGQTMLPTRGLNTG